MPRITAVINQKGGVGKTTSAANLAGALAQHGHSVALLDLDPRADLTAYFGASLAPGQPSIYEALFGPGPALAEILIPVPPGGLLLAPSSPDLAGVELNRNLSARDRVNRIVEPVAQLAEEFDFVILDSPPGLQTLSVGVLAAAGEVIIPQQCSFLALHGLRQIRENLEHMRAINPLLKMNGVLLTMHDRRTVHGRQVVGLVREAFGESVYDAVIPFSVRYQEAAAANLPIGVYAPGSPQAQAYARAAQELLGRG